jgi:hypothetical protein
MTAGCESPVIITARACLWWADLRRFDLEHTIRFAKQTLGWTTPRPRLNEQADRWTWLVLAGYAQLHLARRLVAEQRLPWERPRPHSEGHRCGSAVGFRVCSARSVPQHHTEPLRALPRPTQGPLLGTCGALLDDQEADQEAQQDRDSRLTIHRQHQ